MNTNIKTLGLACCATLVVCSCSNQSEKEKAVDNYKIIRDTVITHYVDTIEEKNAAGKVEYKIIERYDTVYKVDTAL